MTLNLNMDMLLYRDTKVNLIYHASLDDLFHKEKEDRSAEEKMVSLCNKTKIA